MSLSFGVFAYSHSRAFLLIFHLKTVELRIFMEKHLEDKAEKCIFAAKFIYYGNNDFERKEICNKAESNHPQNGKAWV